MSKWFKNKETGVVWEVADENLIKRLASNENAYQEVTDPTAKKNGKGNTSKGDNGEGNTGDSSGAGTSGDANGEGNK